MDGKKLVPEPVEDSVCCRLTSFWAIGCYFFINLAFKLMFIFLYILSFFYPLFFALPCRYSFVSRVSRAHVLCSIIAPPGSDILSAPRTVLIYIPYVLSLSPTMLLIVSHSFQSPTISVYHSSGLPLGAHIALLFLLACIVKYQ